MTHRQGFTGREIYPATNAGQGRAACLEGGDSIFFANMRRLECGASSRLPFVHSLFACARRYIMGLLHPFEGHAPLVLVIVLSRFLPKIEERQWLAVRSEISFPLSYIFAALLFASSAVILIKC
jgi:hypothetical protein